MLRFVVLVYHIHLFFQESRMGVLRQGQANVSLFSTETSAEWEIFQFLVDMQLEFSDTL